MQKVINMATEHDWKPLYKAGGIALAAMVGIILIQMFVFMAAPPPYEGSALEWFELFQSNHLIGLAAVTPDHPPYQAPGGRARQRYVVNILFILGVDGSHQGDICPARIAKGSFTQPERML